MAERGKERSPANFQDIEIFRDAHIFPRLCIPIFFYSSTDVKNAGINLTY